jgi:hypothetical protein
MKREGATKDDNWVDRLLDTLTYTQDVDTRVAARLIIKNAINERERLREALRQVRAMFFEDARSGANVVDGKLVIADDDLHPWIPGARAPRAIAIIDAALNE